MENLKLTLCYDGSRYHGWQRQQNAVAVQQVVEEALAKIVKEPVSIIGCSRTDAGVHAKQFVCNVRTNTSVPDDKMPYAMNCLLPDDICVLSCERVEEGFHARFDTVAKEYYYIISHQRHRDPFLRNYAWHVPYALDVSLMQQAANDFIGTYDCSAFEATGSDIKGTKVRTVYHCEVTEQGNQIEFRIRANGYLYNMVRIMMGTLLSIGMGKLAPSCIPEVIASGDRRKAGPTAPPQGLYLSQVWYQKEDWCS